MARVVLILMLVAHAVATWFTLKDASIWSVFPPFRDQFVYQMFSDLVNALGLVLLLCYLQLRKKKRPMTGLVVTFFGTILFGSFAPLVFLIIEKDLFEA